MATSVTTSLPMWLTGCTYDGDGGNDLRNSGVSALWYDQGIVTGSVIGVLGGVAGGAGLMVSPGGGMSVSVQPGSFVVPNTAAPVAGGYTSTLPQSATLAVQTADPSNPRIDVIVANVVDNGDSTSFGQIQIITGTPAATPSAPAAAANSITLAQISVPALTTTITSGLITDTRPYTTAAGGVLVATKGSVTGYVGQMAYDRTAGMFYHNSGLSGSKQVKVLPFAPVYKVLTSGWSYPNATGGLQTVGGGGGLTATVTTDGSTDLKITYHVGAISAWSGGSSTIQHAITIDGTVLDVQDETLDAGSAGGGVTAIAYTSSVTGSTPSAGPHTVAFVADTTSGSGGFPAIHKDSNSPIAAYLRIEPVVL